LHSTPVHVLYVLTITLSRCSTLFPYTTLFRSSRRADLSRRRQRPRPVHAAGRRRHLDRMPDADGSDALLRHGRGGRMGEPATDRSEEHTSELQSRENLVCRLLLEKINNSNLKI